MIPLLLSLPLLAWALLQARALHRRPGLGRLLLAALGLLGVATLLWLPAAWLGLATPFGLMSLSCAVLFAGIPLLCAAGAVASRGRQRAPYAVLGVALILVGADAYLVEPHLLQQTRVELRSERVEQPLRVVLLADIQTDRVGRHEARALAMAAAAEPDLVLFSGDHVQLHDGRFPAQARAHASLVRQAGLHPRLGAYAVRGDVDPDGWPAVFAGTSVQVVQDSTTLDLGELHLTLLDPRDSRSPSPPVPRVDGLHLVVGHSPDFALARPPADLLLAGHTHGGQVRLPFIGPPLTFSAVPRAWARGHTPLSWDSDLVVSAGIGLERQDAPPIRFLCPPEVVIVDILPAGAVAETGPDSGG